MAWWTKFVLVGITSIFCFSLGPAEVLAASTSEIYTSYSEAECFENCLDEQVSAIPIAPALTSPEEIPVSEVDPSTVSSLKWLEDKWLEDMTSVDAVETQKDSLDTLVAQWLLSMQHLLETQ